MNRLKEKTIATLLITLCLLSVLPSVMAADELTISLVTKNAATVEWSTTQKHSGVYSAHLETTGTPGSGDEATIVIVMPEGFTLGDLETLSWYTYLVAGSTAHVDILLDLDVDGDYDAADDALVIQYAYNDVSTHYLANLLDPSYGAETGAWYQTFGDDGGGPTVIDDDAMAWATKGAAGAPPESPNFHFWSLGVWKAGVTYSTDDGITTKTIDEDSIILRLEIEVDNWGDNSEAFVDDIEINGGVYDLESSGTMLMAFARPPVVSISVSPLNIDFGEVILGTNYDNVALITILNTGEVPVDLTASLIGDDGFYGASLKLDELSPGDSETDWSGFAPVPGSDDVSIDLDVDRNADPGTHTAVLVFWAEENTLGPP